MLIYFEMKDVVYEDGILIDANWDLTKIQDGEVATISSSILCLIKFNKLFLNGVLVLQCQEVNPTSDLFDKGFLGLDATDLSIESSQYN